MQASLDYLLMGCTEPGSTLADWGVVIDRSDGGADDKRIAELARELASAINRGNPEERSEMRDLAIDLLKESVEPAAIEDVAPQEARERRSAPNPFALGLPLLLVGPFLGFLFPPVGLFLILLGVVLCAVGIALAIGRSAAARWRGRGGET